MTGPADRFLGELVEALGGSIDRGLFVVIAFYDRAFELLDELHAFARIRVVADDISEANEVGAVVGAPVRQPRLWVPEV